MCFFYVFFFYIFDLLSVVKLTDFCGQFCATLEAHVDGSELLSSFWGWSWSALGARVGDLGRSWCLCGRSWLSVGVSMAGLGSLSMPLWVVLGCGSIRAVFPVGDIEVLLAPLNSLRRSSFQRTSVFPRSAYFSSGSAISSLLALS